MKPETPSDPEPRFVELPTGPVSYTDEGTGLPVVAIHGLPGSIKDFRWLGAAIEPHARFIRIDQPGFGQTPLQTMPYGSVQWRADHLAEVLDALEVEKAVILGHSMGGAMASAFDSRHHRRTLGLALIASVGARQHRRKMPWPTGLSLALRVPPFRWVLMPRIREATEQIGFLGHDDQALIQCVHLTAATSYTLHEKCLRKVRAPTLVAWAKDDATIERDISEQLYWICTPGPRIAFADGGHNIQKSRAIELSEALLAWRNQLSER
ncbi:MAG: alpha/beta hydrolase [Proteobacteria bacterium]|nr:alpha/beta hydrolase [Pseudomonadota bacterium]